MTDIHCDEDLRVGVGVETRTMLFIYNSQGIFSNLVCRAESNYPDKEGKKGERKEGRIQSRRRCGCERLSGEVVAVWRVLIYGRNLITKAK